MYPPSGVPGPSCPVCGTPVTGPAAELCRTCGLPAAGQAAVVVDRIGATMHELARDREALLVTLRAAASRGSAAAAGPWAPPVSAPPPGPLPQPQPQPRAPHRRLSPQQVLLALGALLLVAGALAFVAVAWTRLGVGFQALVMLVVTAAACAASAWAARRALRATEEALAAAGAALTTIDLGAAHALGLFGADRVPPRLWTAVSCLVVVLAGVFLGRLTRSTLTWPVVALFAAQPVGLLLLPPGVLAGPAGVAVVLAVAGLDLALVLLVRRSLVRAAVSLAAFWVLVGVPGGLAVALGDGAVDSWTATGVLAVAGAAAVALLRVPRFTGRLSARFLHGPAVAPVVTGLAAGVVGIALAGSLRMTGEPGPVLAAALGLALLTAAALRATGPAAAGAGLLAGGTGPTLVGWAALADSDRLGPLSVLVLAAAVPAATAAVRVPRVREPASAGALLAPVAALLLAGEAGWLPAIVAGLLLALVGATAFALAAVRSPAPEEWACAVAGTVAGVAAARTSADVGAWGHVALQLAVVGAAAGCYALVARRRAVAVVAVADLVVACWVALAGADVQTPEAYTMPAAAGLLLVALPGLRSGARSWAAEGAAVGVALVPSALVVVATPTALRLVLVVAGAVAITVIGALTHRQAPFVLGAASLLFVVGARLSPYAPLLPRWVTLAAAGLVLLVVGATYERRRQQAHEAVAWVAQMS
jgi:hypothetical protein